MKKCPYCAEGIQDEALKCRSCGEVLVDGQRGIFFEKSAGLSPDQRAAERARLPDAQRQAFESAWQLLSPQLDRDVVPATRPSHGSSQTSAVAAEERKGSSPAVAACLLLIVLVTLGSLVGGCNQGETRATQTASQPKATPASPAATASQLEAFYEAGKSALRSGDFKTAERFLSKVGEQQRDYKDLAELLAHSEVKKIVDAREAEKAYRRRTASLPSVFATKQVNVRSGPDTSYRVVRQATPDEDLKYETKEGEWYKLATATGETQWIHESVVISQLQREQRASAELQLISWGWRTEYGHAKAEGRVKNVSGRSMKNVAVVIEWLDGSGDFVTSANCLIEYNPVLAGQVSPFSCYARANPAMSEASISFKTLFGGTLAWYKE